MMALVHMSAGTCKASLKEGKDVSVIIPLEDMFVVPESQSKYRILSQQLKFSDSTFFPSHFLTVLFLSPGIVCCIGNVCHSLPHYVFY